MRRSKLALAVCSVLVLGVAALWAARWGRKTPAPAVAARVDDTYATSIQPIFDRRCVVCHSCFDSPCQLNLQSFEGVDRGANSTAVYAPDRLEGVPATRMFQDAQTTAEWRAKFGFFPVVARKTPTAGDLHASLLWRAVEQRRSHPDPVAVDIDALSVCPRDVTVMDRLFRANPGKGMPYGFPPLSDAEANALSAWIAGGAGGPPPAGAPASAESTATLAEIQRWESFLDAPDPRSRIVARYLYEHLFLAHLSLASAPGEWFRLVRSRSAAPAPVDEIATTRPYDDPKASFHYRLRRLRETIVEKTHAPYVLNDAKLARLRHLFFDTPWTDGAPAFPSYAPDVAANPFVAFRAIPASARYQFLLDDAFYHVDTFIHGPVCKGQVALNVIDEHFLIFFLSPAADPSVAHPDFLARVSEDLAVPAEGGEGIDAVYARFKFRELAYLKERASFLKQAAAPGHTTGDIWDGDGANRDAVLTVYRHFDSAFVLRGAVGGVPKTVWVLDYPILERMYYDLVAGFDVFGNLVHQISTRRYMNLLRIEAESAFLGYLPRARRAVVRDSWYRPPGVARIVDVLEPMFAEPETRIDFPDPTHAKDWLVTQLVTAVLPPAVVGEREPVQWQDMPIRGTDPASRFERAARGFVAKAAPFVRVFPDATLIRLRSGGADDPVYTLVRNKAHLNIDFMFLEKEERVPDDDTLHLVRGIAASRPNFFLVVNADDADRFAADLTALAPGDASWRQFVDKYGVRRGDPAFWSASDFFNARYTKLDPVTAGILDIARYVND